MNRHAPMKRTPFPPRRTQLGRGNCELRRTEFKRGSSQLRRTELNPVSEKRRRALWTYSKQRREFLDAHPRCQNPLGCRETATEVHHKAGRVGSLLLDEGHWMALCHGCHQWATEHPLAAYDLGISERRVS